MGTNRKILLADDDLYLLPLIRQALMGLDVDITSASDGASALKQADDELPDLIIVDLEMPIMGGLELIGLVRDRHGAAAPPIAVLTASRDPESVTKALRAGAADFLMKPFRSDVLKARVGRLLARTGPDRSTGLTA